MNTQTLSDLSGSDIIDVRDVISRVEELEKLEQPGPVEMVNDEDNETSQDDLFAELKTLRGLLDDLVGDGGDEQWCGGWYPITLIRDSYFEDYARDLVEVHRAIDRNSVWPNNCIDWEKAASELQGDYTTVELEGVSYWYL